MTGIVDEVTKHKNRTMNDVDDLREEPSSHGKDKGGPIEVSDNERASESPRIVENLNPNVQRD